MNPLGRRKARKRLGRMEIKRETQEWLKVIPTPTPDRPHQSTAYNNPQACGKILVVFLGERDNKSLVISTTPTRAQEKHLQCEK